MFTIIGSDGKEYGPVSADQIRTWIAAGRASLDTQARRIDTTEWKRVGDFPEFSAGAGAPPPIAGPGAVVVADPNLADRGARLGAFLVDWGCELVASLPGLLVLGSSFLTIALGAMQGKRVDVSELDVGKLILGGCLLGFANLALLIVQVWMISTRGQSIGKRLIGIKIVRFADGSPAGFVHGWLLRNFVNGIIGCLPWIGLVYKIVDNCFIFGDARRCIHDLIAQTKVVKA